MNYRNKRVAVVGLGTEGQDACLFFLSRGARVTCFDQQKATELKISLASLAKRGVSFKLGADYLADGLTDFDLIVRSPGVKPILEPLQEAVRAGVEVTSATRLFFKFCPAKIIGVTGTKGKGTTSTLIGEILKADGRVVHLLGNIGHPSLRALDYLEANHWVIYELSSFQLTDLEYSPHVAVILFITSDHLDYHATREEYHRAKANIVLHQGKNDWIVANGDNETAQEIAQMSPGKKIYFSLKNSRAAGFVRRGQLVLKIDQEEIIGPVAKLLLLGKHNWENVLAASLSARIIGARLESVRKAVYSFSGLPHRLEKIGETKGISFYNDSFSTTPETTIAAIRSFSQPLMLIVGGSDKGADFGPLGKEIAFSSVKKLFLLGQMGPKIAEAAIRSGFEGEIVWDCQTMKSAVKGAFEKAVFGDVILLSPACASFDLFANYKERGNQFRRVAGSLIHVRAKNG